MVQKHLVVKAFWEYMHVSQSARLQAARFTLILHLNSILSVPENGTSAIWLPHAGVTAGPLAQDDLSLIPGIKFTFDLNASIPSHQELIKIHVQDGILKLKTWILGQ